MCARNTLCFLVFFCCVIFCTNAGSNPDAGLVRHIVAFRFQPNVTAELQQEVYDRYTALLYECVNLTTGERYIVSFDGGVPNSMEGFQQGMVQVYISTFSSIEDRDFFVGLNHSVPYDKYHDAFKQFVGPLLLQPINEGLIVIDFQVLRCLGSTC